MAVLVKVSYEKANEFKGKGVATKVGNKKHQVYFKVYCDDTNIADCVELAKHSSNVVMLEYQGLPTTLSMVDTSGVYITKVFDFGMNVSEQDIKGVLEDTPEVITPVIRLPQEFKDMKFIYDMSTKYNRVRFCGGTVFCLDGCNLGCCGRDILSKKGIKYDENAYIHEGCCCALNTLLEEEVELIESKNTQRKSKSGSSGGKKKTLLFKDLLYSGGKVDF